MFLFDLRILITPLISSNSSRGHSYNRHGIGDVMASEFAVSVVDGRFKTCWAKDPTIGMCCFSVKHAALRGKKEHHHLIMNYNLFMP